MSETSPYEQAFHAISDREQFLETFARDPDNDFLWGRAYAMAKEEEIPSWAVSCELMYNHLGRRTGIAGDVPAEELIVFAKTIRAAAPEDRYALTARQASNGLLWFDVLETFSSPQSEEAKAAVLGDIVNARGGEKFGRALDIGTGTGRSLTVLEQVSASVVGVDRNAALLAEANAIKGPATALVRADVSNLPFDGQAFDLITSQGLVSSLNRREAEAFVTDLRDNLSIRGMYIDTSYAADSSEYYGPESVAQYYSPKGMLADMIVDTVSGKFTKQDGLSETDFITLLRAAGLKTVTIPHFSPTTGAITDVRIILRGDPLAADAA